MTFGERLTELRKERGFSNRNDFANYIGMPSTTLRNYETNVREPGHIFLKQMSDIFHVTIDYLLCMTDDKTPTNQLISFSASEIEHIKKYRDLDNYGKETVNIILDRETERSKTLRNLTQKSGYVTYGEMEEIWRDTPSDPEELERMCPPLNPDDIKKRIV